MNRLELTNKILQYVDEKPTEVVDIAPIIQTATHGQSFHDQGEIRATIRAILRELKSMEEIEYSDIDAGQLGISTGGVYSYSNFKVRSTLKRHRKNEAEKKSQPHIQSTNIFTNNIKENKGVIISGSREVKENQITVDNSRKPHEYKQGLQIVLEHPIIATIIGGLIVAFLVWYFGWNK